MMPALSDLSFTLDGCLSLLVGFYFIGAIWFVCGTRRKNSISDRMPMVSVVVAARNEAIFIEGCLRALGQQDYPSDKYEVIVVDDGSTDGTDRLAIDSQDGPTAMRLLRTGGGGSKKAALSLGISAAKGEIILSTDADCLVAAGWIQICPGDGDGGGNVWVVALGRTGVRRELPFFCGQPKPSRLRSYKFGRAGYRGTD